jgi:cell division protein FtsW
MKKKLLETPGIDFAMLAVSLMGLLTLGMAMVLSASSISSMETYGSAYAIFSKQVLFIVIGILLALAGIRMSFEKWELLARYSFILGIAILSATLVLGTDILGNRNWIKIGPFLIQPSEFAKLGLILFCALQFKKMENVDPSKRKNPLLVISPITLIFIALILGGKDLGTAVIFAGIAFCLLFITGLSGSYFFTTFSIVGIGFIGLVITAPNRLRRFKAVLNPFAPAVYKFAGWQPAHSMMGLASGGLFGVGIGASKQKWANLAEAHTDFIFSVLGEEMGLFGTLLLLCLYGVMLWAIFRVAVKARDTFQKISVAGIGCWLIMQIIINLGTNIGLAPVIGVTLPFMSYGGSSMIANLMAMSFVLKVAQEQGGIRRISKVERRIKS